MSSQKSQYGPGDLVVPGYRLVRRLGNGFSGTVWIARGAGGTEVALKIVELQKIGGRKELQALRTIRNVRHPNLCEVHGFWVKDSSGRLLEDGESEAIIPEDDSLELGILESQIISPEIGDTAATTASFGFSDQSTTDQETGRGNPSITPDSRGVGDPDGSADEDIADIYQTAVLSDHDASTHASGPTSTPDIAVTQESGEAQDSSRVRISGRSRDSSGTSGSGSASGSNRTSGTGGNVSQRKSRAAAEQLIIVMSLGEMTLQDRLRQVRAENGLKPKDRETACGLNADEAIRYIRSSALAIDLLMQQHQIMHGDIKPQNILLVGGEAQVCDFGLANKLVEDILKTEHPFVSPAYGAPEVLDGTGYSRSADQYALAVTYFELRTGLFPFDHRTKASILKAKTTDRFDLEKIAPAERQVLRKAMSSRPQDRYASCTEFAKALAVAAGVEKRGGLNPARVAVGALLLTAIISGAAYYLSPDTSRIATELLEKGKEQLFLYNPEDRYIVARDPLRAAINRLNEGLGNCDDADQERQFKQLLASAGNGLVDEIFEEFAAATPDSGTPLRNRALLDSDLQLLAQSPDASLRHRLDIAELHRSLLIDTIENPELQPLQKSVRQHITTQQASFNDTANLPENVAATVALALTHAHHSGADANETSKQQLLEEDCLADLIRAERSLASSAGIGIPVWLRQRWLQFRSGGNGFLNVLQAALESDATPTNVKSNIQQTWPQLADEATLTKLRQLAETSDWDEFVATEQAVSIKSSDENTNSRSLSREANVFTTMAESFKTTPTDITVVSKLTPSLSELSDDSRDFLRSAITSWLEEISRRELANSEAAPPSLPDYQKLYQHLVAITQACKVELPSGFDQILLARTIETGDILTSDPAIKRIQSRLLSNENPLAILLACEQQALTNRSLDNVLLAKLRNVLNKSQAIPGFSEPFRIAYDEFQRLLIPWHQGESDQTTALLSAKFADDTQLQDFSQRIGKRRSEWLLNVLTDQVISQLGANTDEFLVSKIEPSQDWSSLFRLARKWQTLLSSNQNQGPPALQLVERLQQSSETWPLPSEILNRLAELDRESPATLSPEDRLVVRIAFNATRPLPTRSLPILLQSSGIILDRGLSNRVATRDWINEVITPNLLALSTQCQRDRNQPDGWNTPAGVNARTIRRLVPHVFRAQHIPLLDVTLGNLAKQVNNPATSANGELHKVDAIELCCAVSATDSELDDQTRHDRLIDAAEFFQQQMDLRGRAWDEDSLLQFARYIKRADRFVPNSSDVAILKSFALYQQALIRLAKGANVSGELRKAAADIDIEIDKISDARPTVAHYNACWRHANLLVNLAFLQTDQERKPSLMKARKRAAQSLEMLADLPRSTVANPAYMAMGNACEDLAHYCRWEDATTPKQYFDDAIQYFSEAVEETRDGQSLRPRYSLARCRFRYFESGLGGRDQLRQAVVALGEMDPSATISSRVEWLAWSSKIHAALGDKSKSLSLVRQAYEELDTADGQAIDVQKRNEIIRVYAERLAASDQSEDRDRALRLIDEIDIDPSSKTFWEAHLLRCQLKYQQEEYEAFAEQLQSVDLDTAIRHLRRAPAKVLSQLTALSSQLFTIAFPRGFGDDPQLEESAASDCINYLASILSQTDSITQSDPLLETYATIMRTNLTASQHLTLQENVKSYLAALEMAEQSSVETLVRNDARRILIRLFSYYLLPANSHRTQALTQLVKQLPLLPATTRQDFERQIQLLLESGVALSEDEKNVVKNLPKIFDRYPPTAD